MTNPFIIAIRQDPQKFFAELDTEELRAIAEGSVEVLAKRAKEGDSSAPRVLQAIYRAVANIEI